MPTLEEILSDLGEAGISLPSGQVRLGGYGDSATLSSKLIALIRSGKKRAGTSLVWLHEFEHEPLGEVGDLEIVLNHLGKPSVITRTLSVSVVPYAQVTAEYAAIEGEGDGSLDYWRRGHWAYFSRVCARIGRTPTEHMDVVCTVFEVLHVLPDESAV